MIQDTADHRWVFDQRDQLQTAPASGTLQDVEPEASLHLLGQQPVRARPICGAPVTRRVVGGVSGGRRPD